MAEDSSNFTRFVNSDGGRGGGLHVTKVARRVFIFSLLREVQACS